MVLEEVEVEDLLLDGVEPTLGDEPGVEYFCEGKAVEEEGVDGGGRADTDAKVPIRAVNITGRLKTIFLFIEHLSI